jgi:hypothetical protein
VPIQFVLEPGGQAIECSRLWTSRVGRRHQARRGPCGPPSPKSQDALRLCSDPNHRTLSGRQNPVWLPWHEGYDRHCSTGPGPRAALQAPSRSPQARWPQPVDEAQPGLAPGARQPMVRGGIRNTGRLYNQQVFVSSSKHSSAHPQVVCTTIYDTNMPTRAHSSNRSRGVVRHLSSRECY